MRFWNFVYRMFKEFLYYVYLVRFILNFILYFVDKFSWVWCLFWVEVLLIIFFCDFGKVIIVWVIFRWKRFFFWFGFFVCVCILICLFFLFYVSIFWIFLFYVCILWRKRNIFYLEMKKNLNLSFYEFILFLV